jgi:hypothetical protein
MKNRPSSPFSKGWWGDLDSRFWSFGDWNLRFVCNKILYLSRICHSRANGNPGITKIWIPAPRFRGDKFIPAEAGAGMTEKNKRL